MSRPDGGPAFPANHEGGTNYPREPCFYEGMTLRDWFAGRVLANWPSPHDTGLNEQQHAANCYEMADAMLAERDKQKG